MEVRRCAPAVPPKPRRPPPQDPKPAVPRSCVAPMLEPSYSARLYANDRLYTNLAAPPSPVSSSYSELRRASDRSPYESLYEPINPPPRPPSQLSSASQYSVYGGGRAGAPPEAEVDALTELMVRSLGSNNGDADAYGVCAECGERVVGEASGCTAMERVYHVACFRCRRCAIGLQGEPFYPIGGEPHCEPCYLNTLEKCCVCTKPILDRILRATGKPYHPSCFACVVCGESLDGIPFTVDATNRIHCIEDFHKKFAPRCCVCRRPIMPEPGEEETVRVVALDRSFHVACYKCEDCGLPLSSEADGRGCYPLDDHVLCKSCNARRVQALSNRITAE